MFFERIACLTVKGCGLVFGDRKVLDTIVIAASEMLVKDRPRQSIRNGSFEGQVSSHSKKGVLGSLIGHMFTVELESEESNRVTMDFILTRPMTEGELALSFWASEPTNERTETAHWN